MAIGVPRPLALEKPQAVDLAQAARYFGAHGEPDAATLALLQKCAVPLLAAATPRAVWLLADTPALTDAGLLPGEDVHKHLKGCGQAILLAVTLGPGVDAQIRRRRGRHRRRGGLRCLGQRTGRADRRCRRGTAAPVGGH